MDLSGHFDECSFRRRDQRLHASGLALVDRRGFHVNIRRCSRVVAEGLGIHAPAHSRNTDGVHVGLSSHIRVLDSVIGTGDDCVSVGPGSVDVVVHGVICGPGHGLRSKLVEID
jgi:galacturan 1,4-alpha-galacturonidase